MCTSIIMTVLFACHPDLDEDSVSMSQQMRSSIKIAVRSRHRWPSGVPVPAVGSDVAMEVCEGELALAGSMATLVRHDMDEKGTESHVKKQLLLQGPEIQTEGHRSNFTWF